MRGGRCIFGAATDVETSRALGLIDRILVGDKDYVKAMLLILLAAFAFGEWSSVAAAAPHSVRV